MKIVCFGDSLTSCGGEDGRYSDLLQDRFPDHQFVNRGVGGNTFVDALARLDCGQTARAMRTPFALCQDNADYPNH